MAMDLRRSRPLCCQLTTLGKLFTRMCLCDQTVKPVLVKRRIRFAIGKVTARLAESSGIRR